MVEVYSFIHFNNSGFIPDSLTVEKLTVSNTIDFENQTDKIVNSEDITYCDICFGNKSNIITDCAHQYCKSCLTQWFNKNKDSCPCCKNKLSNDKLFNIKTE